ncbi:DUF2069 domain-containing protein [Sphaerotilus sp.]|jgi:uncharacterized membrane protein|uniref:DUF2069 domain-containing protein n=1 Tax=Sphaerotilus sp. TaxID=2093942 RepID=UPI00286E90BD|nr:DUF2069 domain-containing protein [Sphaerotilus sp.]
MTEPSAQVPTSAVQRSRWLSFGTCLALLVLGLLWELSLARTGAGTLAIKVVPLVFALPGLWRMKLYTYRWLSLAVWLYAAEGAVRINSAPGREVLLAGAEIVLSVLLFTACAWHVRARLAAGRQAPAAAAAA